MTLNSKVSHTLITLSFLFLPFFSFAQNSSGDNVTYADLPLIELSTETSFSPTFVNPTTGMTSGGGASKQYYFRTPDDESFRSIGHNAESLAHYIEKVPEAYAHIETYRNKKSTGIIVGVLGGVSTIVGITAGSEKTGEQTYNYQTMQVEDKYRLTSGGIAGVAIGIPAMVIGIFTASNATEFVEKAVISYNHAVQDARDMSYNSERQKNSKVTMTLTPSVSLNQAGVSLNISF